MRLHYLSLTALLLVASSATGSQVQTSSPGKDYVSEIKAARKARDKKFLDEKTSPLGIVALVKLEAARTTIGSDPEADLKLTGKSVAPIHAVVIREGQNEPFRWVIKPVGGKVINERNHEAVASAELRTGDRYEIGHQVIYLDQLGTLGPVLRAFDPRAEAFTRFKGLSYFPIDSKFRVEAEVVPAASLTPMTIMDTNGWKRSGWKYGAIHFKLEGQDLALHLWLFSPDPGPEDKFFVAFRDETNGDESYDGGRYLDVPVIKSGPTFLDFNRAYNPSCAYNKGFACPIPPPENRLPVAVKAGEKVFTRH